MDDADADALRAEVERRLQPLCPDWPPDVFAGLIDQIVSITIKYDLTERKPFEYDRRGAERLIAEMKALADRTEKQRGK